MSRTSPPLSMSPHARVVLARVAVDPLARPRDAVHARVLLDAAEGLTHVRIAARHGVSAATVHAWRRSFEAEGIAGLGRVRPGRGHPGTIPGLTLSRVIQAVRRNERAIPPSSIRELAIHLGVSAATVRRVRRDLGLVQGADGRFDVRDPSLVAHHGEVCGVFVGGGHRVLVFSLDPHTHARLVGGVDHGSVGDPARHPATVAVLEAALHVLVGSIGPGTDLGPEPDSGAGARAGGGDPEAGRADSGADTAAGRADLEAGRADLERFLARAASCAPRGVELHVVMTGPGGAGGAVGSGSAGRGLAQCGPGGPRVHVRTVTADEWVTEVRAALGHVVAASVRREHLCCLPDLIAGIDRHLAGAGAPAAGRAGAGGRGAARFEWVATREDLLREPLRSREDLLARTSQF